MTIDEIYNALLPKNLNGCRLWPETLCHAKEGYGAVWFNGKMRRVTRVLYAHAYGPIPDDKLVLHTCDVPACCELSHLFVGTNKDNATDRAAKKRGRDARGTKSGVAKVDENTVIAIRDEYKSGNVTQIELAAKYRISQTAVSNITTGRYWSHVPIK